MNPRSFALVPAAGLSRRMGRHKLLLPFADSTVIEQLLRAWLASPVEKVIVVVRRRDTQLQDVCRSLKVHLVTPLHDPPEMKVSIQHGLEYVAERFLPAARDAWLLGPADMPRLNPVVVEALMNFYCQGGPRILVPTHAGRRGHPVVFPWTLASEVKGLAEDEGVNALLKRHPLSEVDCADAEILDDLDTPEDYARLRGT